jgi:hypothetical protein
MGRSAPHGRRCTRVKHTRRPAASPATNSRLAPDREIVNIADYVAHYQIKSKIAYSTLLLDLGLSVYRTCTDSRRNINCQGPEGTVKSEGGNQISLNSHGMI